MRNLILTAVLSAWAVPAPHAQTQNVLSEQEKLQGFELLFDGTAASFRANFVDYQHGSDNNTDLNSAWKLDAANQAIKSGGSDPDIRSKLKYRDFDLRLDYRNPGNQGIVYRFTTAGTDLWNTGVEFGIDDGDNSSKSGAGSAYDLFAPERNPYKRFSTGQWNSVRIVAVGDSVEHWINGVKVVGYKYHNKRFWDAYDSSKWNSGNELTNLVKGQRGAPGEGFIATGYIGFQADHGGTWLIRNLRINNKTAQVGPGGPLGVAAPRTRLAALPARDRPGLFLLPWRGGWAALDGRRQAGSRALPALRP